jgi:hypothetical protein
MGHRRFPADCRDREPTLAAWRAGGYELGDVQRVLTILARAFDWSVDDGRRVWPDDRVWSFYHHYYPGSDPTAPRWRKWVGSGPDQLEMETLVRDLSALLPPGQSLDLHSAVTVGELVRLLRA